MILNGDDIRKHLMLAEKYAENRAETSRFIECHGNLALWVIAEQLYEIRQLIGISLEKEK